MQDFSKLDLQNSMYRKVVSNPLKKGSYFGLWVVHKLCSISFSSKFKSNQSLFGRSCKTRSKYFFRPTQDGTGSSNTNPAKVSAVFSLKNQSNFKCIKVFQLSTKDNFWWCIVIQLNISCLFTILKSKLPCKLSLLTWILRCFSNVCGTYWLEKFNYAWRRPIKGLHILL